jgi:hypothetical protein
MKITFDFDGVLTSTDFITANTPVFELIKVLQESNNTLGILTSRNFYNDNLKEEVIATAKKLGFEFAIFTGNNNLIKWVNSGIHFYGPHSDGKHSAIKHYKIKMHFDDDPFEVHQINLRFPGKAVLVNVNQLLQENFNID